MDNINTNNTNTAHDYEETVSSNTPVEINYEKTAKTDNTAQKPKSYGTLSLILGIISLLTICLCLFNPILLIIDIAIAITALILGIKGIKEGVRGISIAGTIVSAVNLLIVPVIILVSIALGISSGLITWLTSKNLGTYYDFSYIIVSIINSYY